MLFVTFTTNNDKTQKKVLLPFFARFFLKVNRNIKVWENPQLWKNKNSEACIKTNLLPKL